MMESNRIAVRISAFVCFVIGLMLFLIDTRYAGDVPQNFKLVIASAPLAIVGAALALLALTTLVLLHRWEHKRHLEHF